VAHNRSPENGPLRRHRSTLHLSTFDVRRP
jgi:hypothetical protein